MTLCAPLDASYAAYEATAPVYDAFTSHHDHETWVDLIEAAARPFGLRVGTMLDVGCGTGKSFVPFLRRGWTVSACDLSPAMLALAQAKGDGAVDLFAGDLRDLPSMSRFDLVLALDDVVNYVEPDRLVDAFAGVERNLGDDGLFVFDVNTLRTFRTFFAGVETRDQPDMLLLWQGLASPEFRDGETAEALLDAFRRDPDGRWSRATARHVQHHHPLARVAAALHAARLEPLVVLGQDYGAALEHPPDETQHTKALFIARRMGAPG